MRYDESTIKIDVEQLMELDLHLALSDLKIEEDTSKVSGETLDYIANLARNSYSGR